MNREERKEASRLRRRREDRTEAAHPEPDPTRRAKRRGGKTVASHAYGLEFRFRPDSGLVNRCDWQRYWRWYATAERRDAAMAAMNRASRCFEYRPIDRRRGA